MLRWEKRRGTDREHPRGWAAGCNSRIKAVSLGWSGVRCEKAHEENPHPGPRTGKHQCIGVQGTGPLGAPPAVASWPSSWQAWAEEHGRGGAEGPQPGLTNWVGGKEVRGGETRDQEKLLAGQAWLRPHDFAAASPNISFHGNPGEKRGAFILASEFTLSQRGGGISIGHLLRGQRTRGVCVYGAGEA